MNNTIPSEEPLTSGKLIMNTTHGDLQIQLWAKQTPLASRNFIQLCMQGYYDNTIFHRMIPSFMIQGGDPSGTGLGGQSIYGQPFKDQFHQRLKFVRRGMLAMANAGKNTNKSQFFITFGQCNHLNKKHTIFGKVVGDTVYNLLSMQSLDTDKNDTPNDPPVIRKIKIITHPFDDIIPRNQKLDNSKNMNLQQLTKQKKLKIEKQKKMKKEEIKKLKNKKKLAFDDEEQIEGEGNKIISSHDVLTDQKLSRQVALTQEQIKKKRVEREEEERKKREIIEKINEAKQQEANGDSFNDLLKSEIQRKKKLSQNNPVKLEDDVLNYKTYFNPQTKRNQIYWGQVPIKQEPQPESDQEQKIRKIRELQQQQYDALKADELNFKRARQGSLKQRRKQLVAQEKTLLSNVEKRKYQYLKKNKVQQKQDQVFNKLQKFTGRLLQNKNNDWMCHKLKFHIDSQNAFSLDRKNQERAGLNEKKNLDDGLKVQFDQFYAQDDDINIDELYELTKK